ncbi:DNA topoisomerase IV [Flavobacterium salilacus subsp. salilacus]|uniref:DNA topoisomerase IV n=1 Tax=Flavobacterium TaxID=237 RepID=UPI001075763D|nr:MULTISPECIES: DNA topoisomerase IV [Flavobacterium]KAF2519279.1 DNA topoisomerase IV [Flavobacterium salilacus subsp. salilacus]MBE1613464.1 DNA topoisomerase IV [Flavobacterium sp. SaA2.13]
MNHKFNYILFFSIFLLASCYNQERNCTDFKTGKFKFEHEIDGEKKVTYFERNEEIEIETFEGKTDTASIRWINDCEYILEKIHPKNMQEQKAVHMKILTTNNDSYTFEFSIVGDSNKQKGTVTKIN